MNHEFSHIDVSVIIVSYNTEALTRACLESVYEQTHDIVFEVFVVDNASKDRSVEMIKCNFPNVNLIENKENKGFAAANNQAIKNCKGRYVLLLNSDTIILDNAIDRMVHFADNYEKVGVFGCRVLNSDMSLQPTCYMFPSPLNLFLSSLYLYKLFPQNRFLGRQHMTWWQRDDTREVDVIFGCFLMVRREAIKDVGMLDERYFIFAEETDWCYRMKKAGWKVLFTADMQIIHHGGQSTKHMAGDMILQLRGAQLQFMRKQYSYVSYLLACGLMWIYFAVRIPAWTLKYILQKHERTICRTYIIAYIRGLWRLTTRGGRGLCVYPKSN